MVTFPAQFSGNTECAQIDLVDDSVIGGSKEFTVTLVNAGSAQVVSPSNTSITIIDDDREY